jgi:recombination protein RecT
MTTEITTQTKPTDLKGWLNHDSLRSQIAAAAPKHLSTERFCRIAITALSRTPKLTECTQASFFKCLLDLSAMGIEPDGRRAYLIPYNNRRANTVECQLIVSYMGLIELIRRSGDVVSIRAETVCENDDFTWHNGQVFHVVDWRKSRGEVQAVYAEAVMKSGEKQTAVMTHEEVEGIRKRSKSANDGPWVTDWAEMAKKTVVRRLSKMLPLSCEIMEQVGKADEYEFGGIRDVTPKPLPKENPFEKKSLPEPECKQEETVEAEEVAK